MTWSFWDGGNYQEWIEEATLNGNGGIDFHEFQFLLRSHELYVTLSSTKVISIGSESFLGIYIKCHELWMLRMQIIRRSSILY